MKIIKTGDEVKRLNIGKQRALINCDKCPCCGEPSKPSFIVRRYYEKKLFQKGRHMKIDCFYCDFCGAEWESDPYEY